MRQRVWERSASWRGLAAVLSMLALALVGSGTSTGTPLNPWTGSGPGTTTVVSDGTSGPAVFKYAYEVSCCASGTWTFSTTADSTGSVKLPWHYAGYHAWFMVTVGLSAFVSHNGGAPTTYPLVTAGPASCCGGPPSGGFDYQGTTTLAVSTGDTYGFTMSGSNGDSDGRLQGTLTIGPFLATTATGAVSLGSTITDSAALTGTDPGAGGTITFKAYADSGCASAPVYSHAVSVSGDGTYDDPGFAPASGGTYYWTASYSGDAATHTLGAEEGCGGANESSAVSSSYEPAITTTASGLTPLGQAITDSAMLSGAAPHAGGTITFTAYSEYTEGCSNQVYSHSLPVDGDGTYADPGFTPLAAGTYYWKATYSGDPATQTDPAADSCGSANELSTVAVPPTISTTATAGPVEPGTTIADSATLTGAGEGAGGTITFNAYSDSSCSTLVYTHDVAVSGDDTYDDPGFVPAGPGTYYWTASYSGDEGAGVLSAFEGCGGVGESTLVSEGNDAWTRAKQIDLDSNGDGGSTGSLDVSGQSRWYKFDVTPGGTVQVDLTNLPANYDLTLFSDIGQAYANITGSGDLQTVSAELGAQFSPTVFTPTVFTPTVFTPTVFTPTVFTAADVAPTVFTPTVFTQSTFDPTVFTPDPTAYVGAQIQSLLGVSANDGTANEHIFANIWNNTGSFYIRVNGRNGSYVPSSDFTVSVHEDTGACGGVHPLSADLTAPGFVMPTGIQTLILSDYGRMTPGADLTAMEGKVDALATRTNGAVVDVGTASPLVAALNAQADVPTNIGCTYAKNLVAGAIKDVVGQIRAANPGLKYIVLVGNDHVLPFFRYQDYAGLGPEVNYVPPVLDDTASEAALKSNEVLSQDAYGASTVLHLKGVDLPIPDLPVGRLVETPAEISTVIDAYLGLQTGSVTPSSSLVTGYDFMASGAQSVEADLSAGIGGSSNDTLITNQGVAPSDVGTPPLHSWTADQLRTKLLGGRHDLIYLGGHFSANNTLAADYATTMNATELAASNVDLANAVVFSGGCHSGYTIVNGDAVPNVTQPLDWTEAFAQKGATLIAGTGYQYGDTDFLAYSQRLYAGFAHALRYGSGAVAVGSALVQAKQQYLADTPSLQGIDAKALLESTLYGLPMLGVNLPAGRIPAPTTTSIVHTTTQAPDKPGSTLGLSWFDYATGPLSLTPQSRQLVDENGNPAVTAHWFTGRDGVVTSPGVPTLPLQRENVTDLDPSDAGKVLRGVGFRGGTYTDSSGVTPLTGSPTTELNAPHPPFVSSFFYPARIWSVNYFGGLTGVGGPTQLVLTPAQYESDGPGSITDVERAYGGVSLRLFYSGNTSDYGGNTPWLAAPPTISRVDASSSGGTVTFQAHVVGDPSAGVEGVWVTYDGVHAGTWESLDLTQDAGDSTLWTGQLTGLSAAQVGAMRFIVQAVNGVGLVTLDDDQGSYYQPDAIPPALQTLTSLTPTTVTLAAPPASAPANSTIALTATLKAGANGLPNEQVTFSVGASSVNATTNASGNAVVQLPLVDLPGGYQLSAAFNGDTAYAGSSASAPFTIEKLGTTLTLSGNASIVDGGDTGMVATLARGGVGLQQRTVAFVLTPASGPDVVQTRITDLNGKAKLGVVPLALAGTYTVRAYFGANNAVSLPDDAVYAGSSSGTSQLTVAQAAVVSITRADSNPTNAGSVSWTVTFNTSVTGVSASSFALVKGGNVTGIGFFGVSGNGATRTVSASTLSGDGTLGLNLSNTAGITDSVGGGLAGTFTGQVYDIDKTKPTVTYSGNAGTYTVDQQVSITCTAADPGPYASGIASTTCANISGRADTFGTGAHGYSATATDHAGNTGSGSTSFTVTVTSSSLASLTVLFVQSSAVYQSSSAHQRKIIDQTVDALVHAYLAPIGNGVNPATKAQLVAGYLRNLNAFVAKGWLTQAQASELAALAAAL